MCDTVSLLFRISFVTGLTLSSHKKLVTPDWQRSGPSCSSADSAPACAQKTHAAMWMLIEQRVSTWMTLQCPLCPCLCCSPGTISWPTVPRCTTTSTRSSRCSPWRSESPPEPRHAHLYLHICARLLPLIRPCPVCLVSSVLTSEYFMTVTSADTGMSQRFLTLEHQQMRRMTTAISRCMSVLVWHL